MKKLLFSAILATTTAFNINAQTKIYDFPFDNSLSASVGTGTFGSTGTSFTTDRHGNPNSALSLNNSNGIDATLSNLPQSSNGRSVSIWFNRQGGGNVGMFGYGTSNNPYMFGILFTSSGGLEFGGADGFHLGISGVSHDTWHHLVVTFNGTSVNVYFNGYLTNQFIDDNIVTEEYIFKLGNMEGYFDDLKIYEGVLSLSQVQELFNETSTTGIDNLYAINNIINIYPNPTKNQINFSVQTNVILTNVTGQVITERKNVNLLDLSDQPSGIYFLTLTDNNRQVVQRSKIVKE
jgi:hypothetical protein